VRGAMKGSNGHIGTVILDLDGTLVDSAVDLARASDLLLGEHGLAAIGVAGTRRLIGHGIANLVDQALSSRGVKLDAQGLSAATERFKVLYAQCIPDGSVLYPGVREALAELQAAGWRLVVCTNKLEAFSRTILDALGIGGFFDIVAGPDTFGVAKPDPAHLVNTLPQGKLTAGHAAIMVGDSEVDIATARAAGIPVIAMSYGYAKAPLATLKPDAVADSFSRVPALVARLTTEQAVAIGGR